MKGLTALIRLDPGRGGDRRAAEPGRRRRHRHGRGTAHLHVRRPVVGLPRVSKEQRKKLATAQRALARRTKGSRNRAKARLRVARLQARLARRRNDALHKATTTIVKNHAVVVIEYLKVNEMTKTGRGTAEDLGTLVQKRANENRSLLDASPRMIRTMWSTRRRGTGRGSSSSIQPSPRSAAAPAGRSMRPAASAGRASSAPAAATS